MIRERTIAGVRHQLIVLKITSSDARGRPKTCVVGFDDTVFELAQGDEFITAWIPIGTEKRVS